MGELRWQLSQLVYQTDGNAVFYLCWAWHTKPLKQLREWEKEGAEETLLFDSDYSVLSRGVIALEQFHCSCLDLSPTTRLSLVMRGSSDMHRIPFDKLRPVGNKVAVVGAELWHTAANQVPGLLNSFGDLTLKSTLASIRHVPFSHFIPALPPSRPWIRIVVSQGAPPDQSFLFHKLTVPGNVRSWRPTFNLYCTMLIGHDSSLWIRGSSPLKSRACTVIIASSASVWHMYLMGRLSFNFRKLFKTLVVLVSICFGILEVEN